jgi:hypothetical protein
MTRRKDYEKDEEPREIEPEFTPEEVARRRDETVKRMIRMLPKKQSKARRNGLD